MSDFLIALATSEKAKNLDTLEISQNRLTDDNIEVFAQAIEQGRNLCPSSMNLSFNAISIDGAWVLADSIKQACDKKVETLELTGNFESAAAKNLISAYKAYFEISVY
jgi:Ran GTPase-activating protein (RanGAP) involved in mRNA processing and transport